MFTGEGPTDQVDTVVGDGGRWLDQLPPRSSIRLRPRIVPMGLRFRRSFKLFPGARVNLGKRGVSVSLGGPGATLNLSGRGIGMTVGLPGTGLSYHSQLTPGPGSNGGPTTDAETWSPPPRERNGASLPPAGPHSETKYFKSAANDRLTTPSLRDLRDMMLAAINQRAEVERTLAEQQERHKALTAERRWKGMWLLAWAFRSRLSQIDAALEDCAASIAECEAWKDSSAVSMDFEVDQDAEEIGASLATAFSELASCEMIWDVESESAVNRKRERSAASSAVSRTAVVLDFRETGWTRTKAKPLHFGNANGPDLYFYPGFVLADGDGEFALLSMTDLALTFRFSKFVEEDPVPRDAEMVGSTWAKVNKDGKPDKRFKDNYEIPVVQYATMEFTSDTGLNEAFMFSDHNKALKFAVAFKVYQAACRGDGGGRKLIERMDAANRTGDPKKILNADLEIIA